MSEKNIHSFSNLSEWYRLRITLINKRVSPSMKAHPVSIMEAIVKGVYTWAFGASKTDDAAYFFHFRDRSPPRKIREGMEISLNIFLCGTTAEKAQHFRSTFKKYIEDKACEQNYGLLQLNEIEARNLYSLIQEAEFYPKKGEICLDFLTPLTFKKPPGKHRLFISNENFIQLFEKRFSRLFGTKITFSGNMDDFSILPYYWNYVEYHHKSNSQPGKVQYIKGVTGPLYIKGDFSSLLPFLVLGSELHSGSKLSNAQGHYQILSKPKPYFDRRFPNKQALRSVMMDVLQQYDSVSQLQSEHSSSVVLDEEKFTDEIYNELKNGSYTPEPNKAFHIRKKDGTERLVEHPQLKDLVVQQHVSRTIYKIFDRFYEKESIGYRKGHSRNHSIDIVKSAIREGYQYVIESDIADFFPSVDLDILQDTLDAYIPQKDERTRSILQKILHTGYELNGKMYEREKGVAQGSPLSPILVNLYLDAFDEEVKSWDVKLVRYADDFIIMTRSLEKAEEVLSKTEAALSKMGLQIKKEKTAITSLKEGFSFLGIWFDRTEVQIEPVEKIKRFKKPLYITEPFTFLSLNGGAVEVYKNRKVIETIPLRRISEIMVMQKSSFSTALLKACTENDIPISITLNTGYHITTIKPDNKSYYDISNLHARRYEMLSDGERLSIAREFAAGKLRNYRGMFHQKYVKGMHTFLGDLDEAVQRMYKAGSVNEIRGLEGAATRKIYQNLNLLINNEAFHIKKRKRRPADRINSLMNFGYYLLFSRINATLRSAGLNPYLGFLHSPENRYESLATDIQELFRCHTDRFITKMINLKVISENDFTSTDSGMYLTHDKVKVFLNRFEEELVHKPRRKDKPVYSLLEHLYAQVFVFKEWAQKNDSLTFYRWKK